MRLDLIVWAGHERGGPADVAKLAGVHVAHDEELRAQHVRCVADRIALHVGLADGALADGFAAHQQAVADDVLAVSWLPAAPEGEGAARTTVQLGPHRADIGLIRHAQVD